MGLLVNYLLIVYPFALATEAETTNLVKYSENKQCHLSQSLLLTLDYYKRDIAHQPVSIIQCVVPGHFKNLIAENHLIETHPLTTVQFQISLIKVLRTRALSPQRLPRLKTIS